MQKWSLAHTVIIISGGGQRQDVRSRWAYVNNLTPFLYIYQRTFPISGYKDLLTKLDWWRWCVWEQPLKWVLTHIRTFRAHEKGTLWGCQKRDRYYLRQRGRQRKIAEAHVDSIEKLNSNQVGKKKIVPQLPFTFTAFSSHCFSTESRPTYLSSNPL